MEEEEGNPAQGQACFESTMNTTALSWSTVDACLKDEYDLVQNAAMKATPSHDCEYKPQFTQPPIHRTVCYITSHRTSLFI
jgi:hypothetical protein